MRFEIPNTLTKKHEQILAMYLSGSQNLNAATWKILYQAINLLDGAQIITNETQHTFREKYNEHLGRSFANDYIDQLLATKNVTKEGPSLTAVFARRIKSTLEKAGLLQREVPQSWLFLTYCVYWWQSFARGYAFEVEIMRDLTNSNIDFQMHDIRSRVERYSPADLIILKLRGDIKTSTYFLEWDEQGRLPNDFYITRLFEKGRERTLIVFQKPFAWELIDGGKTIPSTLENVLSLMPTPIHIEQHGIILVVVDYETWKLLVLRKQAK